MNPALTKPSTCPNVIVIRLLEKFYIALSFINQYNHFLMISRIHSANQKGKQFCNTGKTAVFCFFQIAVNHVKSIILYHGEIERFTKSSGTCDQSDSVMLIWKIFDQHGLVNDMAVHLFG